MDNYKVFIAFIEKGRMVTIYRPVMNLLLNRH